MPQKYRATFGACLRLTRLFSSHEKTVLLPSRPPAPPPRALLFSLGTMTITGANQNALTTPFGPLGAFASL